MTCRSGVFVLLLFFSTALWAQLTIPNGTILPVALKSSLNSRKAKAGQQISARIMQDVPLPGGSRIPAGSHVFGHVLAVHPHDAGRAGTISVRLDTLQIAKQNIAITTSARAIASTFEVHEAQLPDFGPDRGTSAASWTTEQVGGDVVYRGGGPVTNGLRDVGVPTANGVLVRVTNRAGSACGDEINGDQLQALWVFSSDACGTYGFRGLSITHAGRSAPIGQITLSQENGNVNVPNGSGMLLRMVEVGRNANGQ